MIFIANTLVMNGGTTFLIRMTRELAQRGQRAAILLLSDRVDPGLVEDLRQHADILHLSNYLMDRGVAARGLLGVFAPVLHRRLAAAIAPYGHHLHAMGLFGLLLGMRIASFDPHQRLTVGVYHQNEFLYRPPSFYIAMEGLKVFSSVPASNVIFFNESSRDNYDIYFKDQSYMNAPVLPIGIAMDQPPIPPPKTLGQRIVSIGNLTGFKTYNRHMIGVVAALRKRFPDIQYDIYGVGPAASELTGLIERMGVRGQVTLRGALEYGRLREVVAGCDLFVGSGTALVEAAALGRPALIGIESVQEPETYGYLSNARGYSYNENIPNIPKQPIAPLVERLFSDRDHWTEVAAACAIAAQRFSIRVTAEGFETVGGAARRVYRRFSPIDLARLGASAVAMRCAEKLGCSEPFGERRNQSY